MAGSDYDIIASPGFPRGGSWLSSTSFIGLNMSYRLYKTGVIMEVLTKSPNGPTLSHYAGELSSGEFTAQGLIMKLRKDGDGWIYGIVRYYDPNIKPFAFAGFYNGDEGGHPRALRRLRAFLLDEGITTAVIDMGQDDAEAVADHANRASSLLHFRAIAATAEVIERRAVELREAIDGELTAMEKGSS